MTAGGGLVWVHLELKADFDTLQAQLMKGKTTWNIGLVLQW
jgi:hypothetical protein